jgi:hypothetical protein
MVNTDFDFLSGKILITKLRFIGVNKAQVRVRSPFELITFRTWPYLHCISSKILINVPKFASNMVLFWPFVTAQNERRTLRSQSVRQCSPSVRQ